MDIDFLEIDKYLDFRKNKKYFIFQDNLISINQMDKIKELIPLYGLNDVLLLFEKNPKITQHFKCNFIIEIECKNCKNISIKNFSKTDLNDFLKVRKNMYDYKNNIFFCENCINENNNLRLNEIKLFEEKRKNEMLESTQNYINNYLNENNGWKKDIKFSVKWDSIRMFNVNIDEIAKYIKSMDYYEFLNTLYWKTISAKKKRQSNFKCQICNSNNLLATHHRNYEIRGYELQNMNDLIVLCNDCHKKHHEIIE